MLADVLSFEIRPITKDDLGAVLEVYRQCEDFLALGPEQAASMAMVRKDVERSLKEGGVFSGVYTAEGRMIGIADFVPCNFEGNPHVAFFELLMIAASYRSRGIGTLVVGMVETEIRKGGKATSILTAVQVNNPKAMRFWQKNGYRVVGAPKRQPDRTTTVLLRKDFGQKGPASARP